MKSIYKYSEIGKLHLFKPDYLTENKKTLLNSNIINEYLIKRKGKIFYKVNFVQNRFNVVKKEKIDFINRKLQLKVIEDSYKEMLTEIHKRLSDNSTLESNKSVKSINSNYNLFCSPRNKSKNGSLFQYSRNSLINDYYNYEKRNNSTSQNSIFNFSKTKNDIYMNKKESIFEQIKTSRNKNLKSMTNFYLMNKNKRNYPQETNLNELNYKTNYELFREIKKSSSNNNIKNKDIDIDLNNNEENNIYFPKPYNHSDNLRKKYNFFTLSDADNMNSAKNIFRKIPKTLFMNKKVKFNHKFHLNFVKYFIDNIKRKEKEKIEEITKLK